MTELGKDWKNSTTAVVDHGANPGLISHLTRRGLVDIAEKFVRDRSIPKRSANAAERALRPAVLWRKGCFGTHSAAGSRFVERMLTVAATLKQQRRNVVDYVTDACVAALHHQPASSLLPSGFRAVALAPAVA